MVTVGIDVGGSTTKIVGFTENNNMLSPVAVKAADPVTSVYGALGRFTTENRISLPEIDRILITGVGGGKVSESLYGRPLRHVNEFECFGRGGLFLTGLGSAIAISLGTGTAIVYADKAGKCDYLGGTGVGGGTLLGLSRLTIGMDDLDHICELAKSGDISNIDLRVGDLMKPGKEYSLPNEMTASNFGKLSDVAEKSDIALGILNMVFETVGMMAVFAARGRGVRDIVLTGHLATVPAAKHTFDTLSNMMNVNFIIPENPQFATAIGAALNL